MFGYEGVNLKAFLRALLFGRFENRPWYAYWERKMSDMNRYVFTDVDSIVKT